MNEFFKELFQYHHHYNQLLLDEFEKHKDKLPERSYPLFCHVIDAHNIWTGRILKRPTVGVNDVHSIDTLRSMDKENFAATSEILETRDLNEVTDYKTSRGEPFSNLIRDILFHVANHTTHHRGQLLSDFRQAGIQPIVTDYIFYKRG
jgi:uncharacterized damage-inducible protein DinB